jgi:hypothetical protein
VVIAGFVMVHLANHLLSLYSIAAHIAFMKVARTVYRHPVIEFVLLVSVIFQGGSGLWMVVRGWSVRQGAVAWLQATSGGYLAVFLLIHVSAIMLGRFALHLDTNFYFAAAGFHVPPFQLFFIPYYLLAVVALFTHVGCACYWSLGGRSPRLRRVALSVMVVTGCIAGVAIDLSLAGKLQPVTVPDRYLAAFRR